MQNHSEEDSLGYLNGVFSNVGQFEVQQGIPPRVRLLNLVLPPLVPAAPPAAAPNTVAAATLDSLLAVPGISDEQRNLMRPGLDLLMQQIPEGRRAAFLTTVQGIVNDPAQRETAVRLIPRIQALSATQRSALLNLTAAQVQNPEAQIGDANLRAVVAGYSGPERDVLVRLLPALAPSSPQERGQMDQKQQKDMVEGANKALSDALNGRDVATLTDVEKMRIKGRVMMSHGVDVSEVQEGGRTVFRATAPTEQWGLLLNKLGGLIMIITSFKREIETKVDQARGNTPGYNGSETIPDGTTAPQRRRIEGMNYLRSQSGAVPLGNNVVLVGNLDVGGARGNTPVTLRFEHDDANGWRWKDRSDSTLGSVSTPPYRIDEAGLTPVQIANRNRANEFARRLAEINARMETDTKRETEEKVTKESSEKLRKSVQAGIAVLDSAVKRYQDFKVGSASLPPMAGELVERIQNKKNQINDITASPTPSEEQRKVLRDAGAELTTLRNDVFKVLRKEGGSLIASSPVSYANGLSASNITGAHPQWTINIDGHGDAGEIRIVQTGDEWRIAFSHKPWVGSTKWPSASVLTFRTSSTAEIPAADRDGARGTVAPSRYFTNRTGAAQADSVVNLLKRLQEDTPLTGTIDTSV